MPTPYKIAFAEGLQPDPDWTITEWSDRRRKLAKGASPEPGQYRSSRTPYLIEIMDELSPTSPTEEVVAVKPTQTGFTEVGNNLLFCVADLYPAPCIFGMPTDQLVERHVKKKINPSLRAMGNLGGKIKDPRTRDAGNTMRLKEFPGGNWTFTGCNSPVASRSDSVRFLVRDDYDGWIAEAGAEGDPGELMKKRTDAYGRRRKIYTNSTPTVKDRSKIQAEFDTSSQGHYSVPCPCCGFLQFLEWGGTDVDFGIKFERDADGQVTAAWYVCRDCGARIKEHEKTWMMDPDNGARFIHKYPDRKKRGFKINGLYSPVGWVSWVTIAQEFVDSKGKPGKRKVWHNTRMADVWTEYERIRTEDAILVLRDDRPRGRVPGGGVVAGVFGSVDTQDDGYWYRIRAFGFGGADLTKESWGIREGFVRTDADLEQVLFRDVYMDADGVQYVVQLAIIDALGHRTADVYKFCLKHRGRIFPSFGRQTMTAPYSWTNLEWWPGTKKAIPGGLRGINVNTKYFKDELSSLLSIEPDDPGAWHENAEFTRDMAQHMTAEYINAKGHWECPGGKANHLWDCAVLSLVAHEISGIKYRPKPEAGNEHRTPGRRVRSKGVAA